MVRVDVVMADMGGVYIDGAWQEAESIDCNCVDAPEWVEKIYTFGNSTPESIVASPPRREWTVTLYLEGDGRREIHDPEVHIWNNQREYRAAREQYIIQEMQP